MTSDLFTSSFQDDSDVSSSTLDFSHLPDAHAIKPPLFPGPLQYWLTLFKSFLEHKNKTPVKNRRFVFWLGWKDLTPRNGGTRIRCLTTWRHPNKKKNGWARWIRTIGMQESKSCALPLGYSPICGVGNESRTHDLQSHNLAL